MHQLSALHKKGAGIPWGIFKTVITLLALIAGSFEWGWEIIPLAFIALFLYVGISHVIDIAGKVPTGRKRKILFVTTALTLGILNALTFNTISTQVFGVSLGLLAALATFAFFIVAALYPR